MFKIGLLGLGTVGTGVAKILLDPVGRNPLIQKINIHRVGIRSLDKTRDVLLSPDLFTTTLEEIVTDPQIDIVVELLGGLEPSRTLILKRLLTVSTLLQLIKQ